ncbi:metal-sensing transcriptional repressor [candidate division WOR-3 bacterium]|nr:metal-sensing transcriptional repressor [candidate division WOR-3 bacterium]
MKEDKNNILLNLKKARSHVEKIIEMVENDKECISVMQQNLAVIGLLRSSHEMMLRRHLKKCFGRAFDSGSTKTKNKMIEEVLAVSKLFNR